MKLAWSAIVKNEAAVLDRCVQSLLPHIDGAVVVDTGSTDGTPELLERLFDQAGKPLELHFAPFENFSQARNEALQKARASNLDWDWLLLADADMTLVVDDPNWTKQLNGGPSYDVKQVAGGTLTYWNRRLLSRTSDAEYVCPTHEFLNATTAGSLEGLWFVDYADGANRPDKLERDIKLLEHMLKTETSAGLLQRGHYYLGKTYFEAGNWEQAALHFFIRTGLGGFDEEVWNARLHYAHCLDNTGDKPGFLFELLQAYNMRPQRAEALYDLAKFFRERGDNHISLLFSEAGMQAKKPNDMLFVNNWVYESGLKEEFAICAYYDPKRRNRGAKECNKLALSGSVQARSNMYWYLRPLNEHIPSFRPQQIEFTAPKGYVPMNPSVMMQGEHPIFLVRTVNYTINAEGGYDIRDPDGAGNTVNPIHTRNFIVRPTTDWGSFELEPPEDSPLTKYFEVLGFEDSRMFEWNDRVWSISCVREFNQAGYCEQVLALHEDGHYTDCKRILYRKEPSRHQKNWMPWVKDGELRFVYRLGVLVDTDGNEIFNENPGFNAEHISGGSQVVQLDERTWVALVHEAGTIPGRNNRCYQHRFVSFRSNGRVDRISQPFVFFDKQIEFAAGLALVGSKQLMVSFGVRDCEAWSATLDLDDVMPFIYKDAL